MPDLNTQDFRQKLLDKERELDSLLARYQNEARTGADVDNPDRLDQSRTEGDTWIAVEGAESASRTLREVRDALERIERGTYGKCVSCGRPIEPERLEASPWTPFCLEDQEKADRLAAERSRTSGLL